MTDVESSSSLPPRANRANNPYADSMPVRGRWHPINAISRSLWMGGSLYFLDRMDTYHNIMHSPNISHEWFKAGLAASIGELVAKPFRMPLQSNRTRNDRHRHRSGSDLFIHNYVFSIITVMAQLYSRSRRTWKCIQENYKNKKSVIKHCHN